MKKMKIIKTIRDNFMGGLRLTVISIIMILAGLFLLPLIVLASTFSGIEIAAMRSKQYVQSVIKEFDNKLDIWLPFIKIKVNKFGALLEGKSK